jgi:hypothetical protein
MMMPKCDIPNCDKEAQNINTALNPKPRKSKWVAEEFGGDGYVCTKHHMTKIANNNGFEKVNSFVVSKHPYKKYRKDFCENIDGRLGFKCTTTIIDPEWQLDTDHINGDPSENREENLQTLCKCCHSIKTRDSKDYASPGRKALNLRAA